VLALCTEHGSFVLDPVCEILLRRICDTAQCDVKVVAVLCVDAIDEGNIDTSGYFQCLRLRNKIDSLWSCSFSDCTNVMRLGMDKFKECSFCHVPRYCCKLCQISHWKQSHGSVCNKLHNWK